MKPSFTTTTTTTTTTSRSATGSSTDFGPYESPDMDNYKYDIELRL
jgi:hypothetical protein